MKPIWVIALLGMNFLWAAAYSLFKLLAPVLDAGSLATLRFGLAAVFIGIAWKWIPGVMPRGWDLVRATVMGAIVFTLAPRLQIAGVQMGNAGDAAILVALDPVIAAVAAGIFLGERVRRNVMIGFVTGLLGLGVLVEFWKPGFNFGKLVPNLLVLASFTAEACYSIVGKPLLKRSHPVKLLACALVSGSIINLILNGRAVAVALPKLTMSNWLVMTYLVLICTIVGYALWFYAVRETPVTVVAMTVFMQPLAGLAYAALLLGETPRWSQFAGGLLVVVGLIISLRPHSTLPTVHPPGLGADAPAEE